MSAAHRDYFEKAYRTGTDVWSHIPYQRQLLSTINQLPTDSIILDLGAGRGLLDFFLVEKGYRVIGLEYIEKMVNRNNIDVAERKLSERLRFVMGDALDIPFVDGGFPAVVEVGLWQHLRPEQWNEYVSEVARVLSVDGLFCTVQLSRQTTMLLGHRPGQASSGHFEKYGLSYYFFTPEEIATALQPEFNIVSQETHIYDSRSDPGEELALIFTLAEKK